MENQLHNENDLIHLSQEIKNDNYKNNNNLNTQYKTAISITLEEINDRKNVVLNFLNHLICQANVEIVNSYKFSKFNKTFSKEMKLKDDKLISSAREVINALQSYILDRINEEKDNFWKVRRLSQNSKKLTKIKMLDTWKKKLNISDREFLLMTAFNENLSILGKNCNNDKKISYLNSNANDENKELTVNMMHKTELEKEIICSRISYSLTKKIKEQAKKIKLRNEELKKKLIDYQNIENDLLERIEQLSK